MNIRNACTLVAGLLLFMASEATAQKPAADPWKKVPAAPTACLYDDAYPEKLQAATEALDAEIEKQEEVNAKIKQQYDEMDMMEKAQRMQAFMMKNPQEAQKFMMATQATGDASNADLPAASEAGKELTAELDGHKARLQTAIAEAVKPAHAKRRALIAAKTKLVGEVQAPVFVDMASWQQYVALVDEENAALEKACSSYFGSRGVLTVWLNDYKTQVIDKTHASDDSVEEITVAQMRMMGTSTEGYHSTQPHRAVREYLQHARQIYNLRPQKTRPVIDMKPAP